jgi:hypothetical protein
VKIGALPAADSLGAEDVSVAHTVYQQISGPWAYCVSRAALVLTTWAASAQLSDSSWIEELGESCLGVGR